MSISIKINDDLKNAIRAQDKLRMETLRGIKTVLKIDANHAILTEQEEIERLSKAAKQRRESAEMFKTGGRNELAEKELAEVKIIEEYLPQQLTEAEIIAIANKAITESAAKSIKDIGLVMKLVMPLTKGKADGKLVQEIVKSRLPL